MNKVRGRILQQTPHFLARSTDLSREEVRKAALCVEPARTVDDLHILAYALYTGALDVPAVCARLGSPPLAIELSAPLLSAQREVGREVVLRLIDSQYAGYAGHPRGRDEQEGWTLAVLDLLVRCRSRELLNLLGVSDPAYLLVRWILSGSWKTDAATIVRNWTSRNDALYTSAASLLVWRSVEAHIDGQGTMVSLNDVPRISRLVISGNIVARLLSWRTHGFWTEERSDRFDKVLGVFRKLTETDMQARPDVKTFVRSTRQIDEPELISFLLSLTLEQKTRDQVLRDGQATLTRLFARVKDGDPLGPDVFPYIAAWAINPLASIALSLPLSGQLFESLRDGLRCDEFAYEFMYSHYLVDRARALLLCAIGAIASAVHGDSELRASAIELTGMLKALPPTRKIFAREVVDEIEERFALRIPEE